MDIHLIDGTAAEGQFADEAIDRLRSAGAGDRARAGRGGHAGHARARRRRELAQAIPRPNPLRSAGWRDVRHEIIPIDIGHTDTDRTTCLHVPSIGLVIAGDAIYNGTHPYLGESNRQGRRDWLAAIDKIEALNPRAVVVGHGPMEPDNAPRHIQETRRYIQDFIRLDDETRTALELYDRMLSPDPSGVALGRRQCREGLSPWQGVTIRRYGNPSQCVPNTRRIRRPR